MRSFLNRLFGSRGLQYGGEPVRDRGRPPSGNGASSLHLRWRVATPRITAARVTLEVTEPPRTSDLYFFALQATFSGAGADSGGAHVGLQWNQRHPGSTAVNWGGYHSQSSGGSVLSGTESQLPSRPDDPNTRDYEWLAHRPYRLTIEPGSEPGWWRGLLTDLSGGNTVTIRELDGGGSHLTSPMVWAEVFAPCDGPRVAVRWTDLEVAPKPGQWERVDTVDVNYQSYPAGGCTNTDARAVAGGFVQTTNTPRVTEQDRTLSLEAG